MAQDAGGAGRDTTAGGERDRAAGALLGLACGDAVGTTLEFRRPGSFTPIDDMVGGGPFGLTAGEWTDDTSMALCLAESLLDRGRHDPADQMRRYLLWQHEGYLASNGRCFDIGNTVSSQLARFDRTGDPVDPHPDPDSAANGSLMRLAPVPIRWHHDIETAAAMSGESSRPTHAASRPVDACRVMGAMVAALIQGRHADDVFAPSFWRWGDLHPAIAAVAAGSWRAKAPGEIRGSGYCVDALEAAIWAVAGAGDVRDAVLRASNLGDDADTTAAIAGQLAGARWGAGGIPPEWLDKLVLRERIRALADGLCDAGAGDADADGERQVGERWPHDAYLHAWWAAPGVLAGEYPGHADPTVASHKVNLLVDHGVRTFIDLTGPDDGLAPYADHVARAAERRGLDLRTIRATIPDLGVLDDHRYDGIVDTIRAGRRRGAVFVHCWGGVGRTGTVVGCLLADDGVVAADIRGRLARLRDGTRKADRPCPETPAQHDVVRRRARRRAAEHP